MRPLPIASSNALYCVQSPARSLIASRGTKSAGFVEAPLLLTIRIKPSRNPRLGSSVRAKNDTVWPTKSSCGPEQPRHDAAGGRRQEIRGGVCAGSPCMRGEDPGITREPAGARGIRAQVGGRKCAEPGIEVFGEGDRIRVRGKRNQQDERRQPSLHRSPPRARERLASPLAAEGTRSRTVDDNR